MIKAIAFACGGLGFIMFCNPNTSNDAIVGVIFMLMGFVIFGMKVKYDH